MFVLSSELGPQASVSPPLDPKGEEQHSLGGEGVGGPDSDDCKESLALCILCAGGEEVKTTENKTHWPRRSILAILRYVRG